MATLELLDREIHLLEINQKVLDSICTDCGGVPQADWLPSWVYDEQSQCHCYEEKKEAEEIEYEFYSDMAPFGAYITTGGKLVLHQDITPYGNILKKMILSSDEVQGLVNFLHQFDGMILVGNRKE
jgi:hypothetical protein